MKSPSQDTINTYLSGYGQFLCKFSPNLLLQAFSIQTLDLFASLTGADVVAISHLNIEMASVDMVWLKLGKFLRPPLNVGGARHQALEVHLMYVNSSGVGISATSLFSP